MGTISGATSHNVDQVEGLIRLLRTADASAVTGTTLTADTVLTTSLLASTNYIFHAVLFISNGGAGEGFKAAMNGTAGVTSMKVQISIFDDTLNTLVGFARVTAKGSSVGAGLSANDNFCEIKGAIEVSTAGTFYIEWAQNAAGAAAGVTVQRSSWMTVTEI